MRYRGRLNGAFAGVRVVIRRSLICWIILFLSSIDCLFLTASAETEIHGTVRAGSTDNRFLIEVENSSAFSVDELALDIAEGSRSITNIRISSDTVGTLPAGDARRFTITFDVSGSAEPDGIETVIFGVATDLGLIDIPNPEMTVRIGEPEPIPDLSPASVTACVLKEGVESFPIEDAVLYCDPDIAEAHEYDDIVVFFTPARDLNDSRPEEFRYRILGPNGRVLAHGPYLRSLSDGEECSACLEFTRPGSPGRFAVRLNLSSPTRLHRDPQQRLFIPGTYLVETIGLVPDAGAGLFGQGQGHRETGAWREEGRFEVKDGNIHFAGFLTELVGTLSMPPKPTRWTGSVSVEPPAVDMESGKVDLHVGAWWRNTKRQPDGTPGPGDETFEGRTSLTMVFPRTIRPGKVVQELDRTGSFSYPLEPVAEIDITWKVDGAGGAVYVPVLSRPTPVKAPISRDTAFEGCLGNAAMDQSLDTPEAMLSKSWIPSRGTPSLYRIGVCNRFRPFGEPARSLAQHFHDRDTLWVLPVRFTLEPSSQSADVDFFGYAVYQRAPGNLDGVLAGIPPWVGTELIPGGDTVAGAQGDVGGPAGAETIPTRVDPPVPGPVATDTVRSDPALSDGPLDPSALEPRSPDLARLIREWLNVAEPVENAGGANFRYDPWGRLVGSAAPGMGRTVGSAPPPDGGGVPEAYAWGHRARLDSIDHCTLEEYVLARLDSASTGHCVGRYQRTLAVPDVTGMPLSEAVEQLRREGFEVAPTLLGPAPRRDLVGRVAAQRPESLSRLLPGARIEVDVHGEHVEPRVGVPDVRGMTLLEAQAALRNAGLVLAPSLLGAAPGQGQSGRVATQRPAAGADVTTGSTVEADVYGEYVPARAGVPDVRGMTLPEAQAALRNAGFGLEPSLLGAAPTAAEAGRVSAQAPAPGSEAAPGAAVRIDLWGEYAPPAPVGRDTEVATSPSVLQGRPNLQCPAALLGGTLTRGSVYSALSEYGYFHCEWEHPGRPISTRITAVWYTNPGFSGEHFCGAEDVFLEQQVSGFAYQPSARLHSTSRRVQVEIRWHDPRERDWILQLARSFIETAEPYTQPCAQGTDAGIRQDAPDVSLCPPSIGGGTLDRSQSGARSRGGYRSGFSCTYTWPDGSSNVVWGVSWAHRDVPVARALCGYSGPGEGTGDVRRSTVQSPTSAVQVHILWNVRWGRERVMGVAQSLIDAFTPYALSCRPAPP
jgi:beta-lactam-binding protein with PASTA domain